LFSPFGFLLTDPPSPKNFDGRGLIEQMDRIVEHGIRSITSHSPAMTRFSHA
jgi:hypothetical protein